MSHPTRQPGAPDPTFLALAFEASDDSIAMLGPDGTIVTINAGGAAAMGFGGPAEAIGEAWSGLWDAPGDAAARRAMAAARLGGRAAVRTSRGGGLAWWDSTLLPAPDPEGSPAHLLVISKDVTAQHAAGLALDRSLRLQQALNEATSEIVWHVDVTTGVTTRRGYTAFTGQRDDPDDMDGWLAAVHPEDREQAKRAADNASATGKGVTIEYRLRHRTDMWRWVEDHATALVGDDGALTDWVGIITDVHDRKTARQALQKSLDHLRLAVEATGLGTWDINMLTGERDWSPEMFDLLRLPRDTRTSRRLFLDAIHPDDRIRVRRELNGCGSPDGRATVTLFRLLFADGERWVEAHERTFFDGHGEPVRRVGTLQDITGRKQAEHEVWLAAHADALTGIANRALFQSRLDGAVQEAAGEDARIGLLLVDLDRFKDVNDMLGHDAGDTLLRAVAERLSRAVGSGATVARLGGDEFGVLVPAAASAAALGGLASGLLAALSQPLDYGGRDIDCSASIGWSVYPDHDPEAGALLKNADVALYAAKSAGRGRAMAFTPAMRAELERRINVLRSAKDALARDAVVPYYQPKVSLASGAVVGFEALLRWTSTAHLHPPAALQEALDDPELSTALGMRMLERVVGDMRAWTAAGVPFGHVALNAAAPEFYGLTYADRVLGMLEAAGLHPSRLEIEVTERVLLDDGAGAIGTALRQLHAAGVQIALDDFGTGFSSLTHLTRFPVGWVKIDRSFIENVERDGRTAAVVTAVIDLAHGIGARVVAEGIETEGQMRLLAAKGCDLGQGFLMAKPMAASRVPHFLRSWVGRPTTEASGPRDRLVARAGRRQP